MHVQLYMNTQLLYDPATIILSRMVWLRHLIGQQTSEMTTVGRCCVNRFQRNFISHPPHLNVLSSLTYRSISALSFELWYRASPSNRRTNQQRIGQGHCYGRQFNYIPDAIFIDEWIHQLTKCIASEQPARPCFHLLMSHSLLTARSCL